jgi:hypothetical protein
MPGAGPSDVDRGRRDDLRLPTISRFFGMVIAMFFDDHEPAHFRTRAADGTAKVQIDTLEAIESTLGRRRCGSCWPGQNCT